MNDTRRTASTVCPGEAHWTAQEFSSPFTLSPRTSNERRKRKERERQHNSRQCAGVRWLVKQGILTRISLQNFLHLAKNKTPKALCEIESVDQSPKHLHRTSLVRIHGFCGSNWRGDLKSNPITKPTSMDRAWEFCGASLCLSCLPTASSFSELCS